MNGRPYLSCLVLLWCAVACKSIQYGGEQKATEINTDLSKVMALISGDAGISPEIKEASLEILGKTIPKVNKLGADHDMNAKIAEQKSAEVKELEPYYWIVWGAVGLAGVGLIAYGALKSALWAKIMGGLMTAGSLAMGFKKLFF